MIKNNYYTVKEIFHTLQGEGFNAGKPAIFCRFTGCNLWNGKETDRLNAICSFCDTDFNGVDGLNGGKYSLKELIKIICSLWPKNKKHKFIVFTGGEPLLQLNKVLIKSLKKEGFIIAVETNGTIPAPQQIDWICVSPKVKSKLLVTKGNELKIVYPQNNINLKKYENLKFEHFYLQPLYNNNFEENNKKVVEYILKNPFWKLSIQSHKYLGIK